MSNFKDLTNKRFGKLTAIYPTDKSKYAAQRKIWYCLCDCGNSKEVSSMGLICGDNTSCSICKDKNESQIYDNNFYNILLPESAYLLGFIWADGSVNKNIRIAILSEDAKEIIPICNKIGLWKVYSKSVNYKEQSEIICNDIKIAQFLAEYDYRSKNKSAYKIISNIPENLRHYFFRGLIDGDGSIGVSKGGGIWFDISGPYDQDWSYVEEYLPNLKTSKYIKKARKINGDNCSGSHIRSSDPATIVEIYKIIYRDKIFGLSRKYHRFKIIEEIVVNNIATKNRKDYYNQRLSEMKLYDN